MDTTITSHADDTVVLVKNNNNYDLYKSAISCLNKIKNWLDNNMLSELNLDKSKCVYFRVSNATKYFTGPLIIDIINCLQSYPLISVQVQVFIR